jgi:AraC-like DNA-binding protein
MTEMSASITAVVRLRSRVPALAQVRPAAAWLAQHPVFATHDEHDLRSFLAQHSIAIGFPPDDHSPLDAHVNGVQLAGVWLGHVGYGREVTLSTTPRREDYWLQVPTHGCFDVRVAREQLHCDAALGAVLSPRVENVVHPESGCGRFTLSLSRDALVRQLSALLGRPVVEPLVFDAGLPLDRGHGRSLARYIRAAAEDLDEHDGMLRAAPARASFEQFVLTALLLSHVHNYRAELERGERRPASRDVRRAIDYIQGNLTAPVTLADIVAAAGVAGRVLFKHFKRCTGTSPMAYLRNARFAGVREALRKARPTDRVVDIAAHWGFDHIGRFAIEYRRRFGEKPSATKAASVSARGP